MNTYEEQNLIEQIQLTVGGGVVGGLVGLALGDVEGGLTGLALGDLDGLEVGFEQRDTIYNMKDERHSSAISS